MLSFRRFERSTVLLMGLLVLSFLTATMDVRSNGAGIGDTLRDGAETLLAPLERGVNAVISPVQGFIDSVSDIESLRDQNDRLLAENEDLRADVLEIQTALLRLEQLEAIHGVEPPGDLATVTARIVSAGTSDFDHIRWIDRGTDDGVLVGQAVIDEGGLVGRIDFVSADSARVRLLTDPNFGVVVRNVVTNEVGILDGRGNSPLRLRIFNATQPVEAGQVLVTDETRFPQGITVGLILDDAESESGFQLTTAVEATVAIAELDFVKVIVGFSPLDAPVDETSPPVEQTTTTVPTQ